MFFHACGLCSSVCVCVCVVCVHFSVYGYCLCMCVWSMFVYVHLFVFCSHLCVIYVHLCLCVCGPVHLWLLGLCSSVVFVCACSLSVCVRLSVLLWSLHQGSLVSKPRCRPFPDAMPVSDCAVCPCHSLRGCQPSIRPHPPCKLLPAIRPDL